jgi:hypothetical protein
MYKEVISLEEALLLEKEGKITIFNPTKLNIPEISEKRWFTNWENLRSHYRKIPVWKLKEFANLNYAIEHKFIAQEDPPTVSWVYIYGQEVTEGIKLNQLYSRGQYIYILTNPDHPDIVKIGKAVNPQKRVKQINNAGVRMEWDLEWALPVTDDYKVESLIHKELEALRTTSYKGSSREYFQISLEKAKEKILYLAQDFITGEPTNY